MRLHPDNCTLAWAIGALLVAGPAWAQEASWGCDVLPAPNHSSDRALDKQLMSSVSGASWDASVGALWLSHSSASPVLTSLARHHDRWQLSQQLDVTAPTELELEAVTVFGEPSRLLVLDSALPAIHEVSSLDGTVAHTWPMPELVGEASLTGLAHVPTGHFDQLPETDAQGQPCTSCTPSINALPGLFLVARETGHVLAFRLEDGGSKMRLYGSYATGADLATGLAFAQTEEALLVLHGDDPLPHVRRGGGLDNSVEVVRLSRMANGQLEPVAYRPYPGDAPSLEGVAWMPDAGTLVLASSSHRGPALLELPILPCSPMVSALREPPGSIDRLTPREAWKPAAGLSDLLLYGSTIGAPLFFAGPELAGGDARPMISNVAAQGVTYGLTTLTKSIAKRPRPYTYSAHYPHHDDPKRCEQPKRLREPDACRSFFSGHTSQTAAVLFSVATSYQLFGPPDRPLARTAMWTGAGVGTGLVGGLRVGARKHFLTDVLVGAIVGVGIGIGSAVATDALLPAPE